MKTNINTFKCHGVLCVCNWGGYEIEINETGEAARLADNFGDGSKVRRWQRIKSNSRGEYVTRNGRKLYLHEFLRV